jgi:hypothetical protein
MTNARPFLRSALLVGGLLVAVGAWATVAACSSGGGKTVPDGAADGISFDWRFGDLPEGCPPTAGNEKGVGKPCSVGGNECSAGLLCACDENFGIKPPADTPCFCTQAILGKTCSDPSIPAGYCGTGASCCGYMAVGSLCVPDVCLTAMMCPVF